MVRALSANVGKINATPWQRRKKRTVAFDSSFLVAVMETPTPWQADIAEKVGAFTPVVLQSVRDELRRLVERNDKRGMFASLALELVARGKFAVEPDGGGKPDNEIISYALLQGAAVATIDSDLGNRLRASRVATVITLRGGRVSV